MLVFFLLLLHFEMRSGSSSIKFLSQAEATKMDVELMSAEFGFSVDQLMELAGLSVACAVEQVYSRPKFSSCLVIAGPGNNGGDGLVAARHLHHFGFNVSVFYPRRKDVDIYNRLVKQCGHLQIPFVDALPDLTVFDVVVDGVFGYSFSGDIRAPFDEIVRKMALHPHVLAIDIPSGWDVEKGDIRQTGFMPEVLVSLTAPKLCAKHFTRGTHFLGGRFVPPKMAAEYMLNLPPYPGSSQIVQLKN